MILEFPDKAMFAAFTNALLDKGHALDTNKQARTVTYSQKDEAMFNDVFEFIKKEISRGNKEHVVPRLIRSCSRFRFIIRKDARPWKKQTGS